MLEILLSIKKIVSFNKNLSKEMRFFMYVGGVYYVFIKWGILQDKFANHTYNCDNIKNMKFNSFFLLNLFMALSAFITASFVEMYSTKGPDIPILKFLKPAVTCALASPLSYFAISNKLISYPLMVLTKSSKPVPVMIIGLLFFKRKYDWFKYVSVVLVCLGIAYYTYSEKKQKDLTIKETAVLGLILNPFQGIVLGIVLVFFNLILDGYTNNDQDKIFSEDKATSIQMMKYTNFWQTIFIFCLLLISWVIFSSSSELHQGLYMMGMIPELRKDILMFCTYASVGQVLIFGVMEDFGSLTWITVSITRKLFSIVVHDVYSATAVGSVKSKISISQWFGVFSVFVGLGLEVIMNYRKSSGKSKTVDTSKSVMTSSTNTKLDNNRSKSPSSPKRRSKSPSVPKRSKSPSVPKRSKSPSRAKKNN